MRFYSTEVTKRRTACCVYCMLLCTLKADKICCGHGQTMHDVLLSKRTHLAAELQTWVQSCGLGVPW